MRADLGGLDAACDVRIGIDFEMRLAPGIWCISAGDYTYALTTVAGCVDNGIPVFYWPRGVERRPSGSWGHQQRILPAILPDAPDRAWSAVPVEVAALLSDSYLLAADALPAHLHGAR